MCQEQGIKYASMRQQLEHTNNQQIFRKRKYLYSYMDSNRNIILTDKSFLPYRLDTTPNLLILCRTVAIELTYNYFYSSVQDFFLMLQL